MRGQAAVEWMVILSVAILVLTVMLSLNLDNFNFFKSTFNVGKVKSSLNDLKNAVDFVYSQGVDAKTRVYISIPAEANFTIRTLASGKGEIEAVYMVGGKHEDFQVYTEANVSGSLPEKAGSYCIDVEYLAGEVVIGRSDGSC